MFHLDCERFAEPLSQQQSDTLAWKKCATRCFITLSSSWSPKSRVNAHRGRDHTLNPCGTGPKPAIVTNGASRCILESEQSDDGEHRCSRCVQLSDFIFSGCKCGCYVFLYSTVCMCFCSTRLYTATRTAARLTMDEKTVRWLMVFDAQSRYGQDVAALVPSCLARAGARLGAHVHNPSGDG